MVCGDCGSVSFVRASSRMDCAWRGGFSFAGKDTAAWTGKTGAAESGDMAGKVGKIMAWKWRRKMAAGARPAAWSGGGWKTAGKTADYELKRKGGAALGRLGY